MRNRATNRQASRAALVSVVLVLAAALTGCDFEVTNPGPVADEFLNDPGAFAGVVNAIPRTLTGSFNDLNADVAVRTRELHATRPQWWYNSMEGHLGIPRQITRSNPWNGLQQARWLGEDAIRRLGEALGGSAEGERILAEAHMWTGYANRMLGEYYCEVTFNLGPAVPGTEALTRAAEHFSTALDVANGAGASDLATAARAALASIRVDLGDWAAAVQHAAAVPTDFNFVLPYFTDSNFRNENGMFEDQDALTVWNTFYEDHYVATNDPRTPWVLGQPEVMPSGFQEWGSFPRLHQRKYPASDADIPLSSGKEMRLIEAEELLRRNDMNGAMTILNALRERVGVDPLPAPADLEEAWTLFKRERGIELWLEGRRLQDLRRWAEDGIPGALDPHELGLTEGGPDLTNRVYCMDIPDSERDTNPNISG